MTKTPRPIPDQLDSLRRASKGQGQLHALMDASLAPELPAAILEHKPRLDYVPLYIGDEKGSLLPISPYLVKLSLDDDLLWWLLDEGQGKSWGIYLCSQAELTSLQHHLFCLLSVRGLEGDKLYFRYYDPRVLRPFWKALTKEEQNQFMGPIQAILVEDEQEPGFWAYPRPQGLEPPPYPPAPNDWTELPEPWWQINHAQQQALKESTLLAYKKGLVKYFSSLAYNPLSIKSGKISNFVDSTVDFARHHKYELERSIKLFCMACWWVPYESLSKTETFLELETEAEIGELDKAEKLFRFAYEIETQRSDP